MLVREMQRAGVKLMTGTDTTRKAGELPWAIHDELSLLVRAGLSPAEALDCATIRPAEYRGATQELGTIKVGRLADLVVLDASPLADIHNTKRIFAVIQDGRLLDRRFLNSLARSNLK
jgi:imidazolonepropionase-like amidohydrolase